MSRMGFISAQYPGTKEPARRDVPVAQSRDRGRDDLPDLPAPHRGERPDARELSAGKFLPDRHQPMLTQGTIVDAIVVTAPSSTSTALGERDPELSLMKKGSNGFRDEGKHRRRQPIRSGAHGGHDAGERS
jgi:hypothetical protein